jgi:hypothetical protein
LQGNGKIAPIKISALLGKDVRILVYWAMTNVKNRPKLLLLVELFILICRRWSKKFDSGDSKRGRKDPGVKKPWRSHGGCGSKLLKSSPS